MSGSTRRGFLAGAAGAAVAAPAAARADHVTQGRVVQAKQEVVRRGRAVAADPAGRRLVVAHDQRSTIAIVDRRTRQRRIVDVGGHPVDVAISPGGRLAAVVTAAWAEPGLVLVELPSGRVRARAGAGPAPFAVAFSSDGRRVVVTGGEQEGTVTVFDPATGKLLVSRPVGVLPRGIAPVPGRDAAWIALSGDDRVARVDLADGRVRRTLRVSRLPEHVAISPDGRRLLVSHGGLAGHVSEIELRSGRLKRHRTGPHAGSVGWGRGGRRLIVLAREASLLIIRPGGRRRRRALGGAPRGLAAAAGRAWTVDAVDDAIRMVRT